MDTWFIPTFLCSMCVLKSTVAFCLLSFPLDIVSLLLIVVHFEPGVDGSVYMGLNKAASIFGLIMAFMT